MWPASRGRSSSSPRWWISSKILIASPQWAPRSRRGCCWWALRVPAKPFWPKRWRAKRACPSSRSPALSLWRCSWAWEPAGCAICSSRPKRTPRASYSSMRSTLSAGSAALAWGVATTNGSRPSTSCSPRWMALRATPASSSWRPPTARMCSMPPCCVPAGSTARWWWIARTTPAGSRSWRCTPAAKRSPRMSTSTRWRAAPPVTPVRIWPTCSTKRRFWRPATSSPRSRWMR